jgi:hypothetical protein
MSIIDEILAAKSEQPRDQFLIPPPLGGHIEAASMDAVRAVLHAAGVKTFEPKEANVQLFGIPIRIDPTLPEGVFWIRPTS